MGQKIIQGDLLVKGAVVEEGISLDTKVSQLADDTEYPIKFIQRFNIYKISKRFGGSVIEY
jgi:hypothetical protein